MLSRRFLQGLSVGVAAAFYGSLILLAPRLHLFAQHTLPPKGVRHFPVKLLKAEPAPPPKPAGSASGAPGPRNGKGLATGPGRIEDLLRRENDSVAPTETLLRRSVEVPRLTDRVASEVVPREHSLSPEPEALARVDSKVIEIAEQTARSDIEIARRIVGPSPERIIAENEFPTLRTPSDAVKEPLALRNSGPLVSMLEVPARLPGGGTVDAAQGDQGAPAGPEKPIQIPPYEENVLLPMPTPLQTPLLPAMEPISRAPMLEAIRKESPYEFIDDLVDMKVDTYAPADEKEGFFRLQIVPKAGENLAPLPKDVTFVIDASTSIVQRKLDGTAKATREMVGMLRPEDRFNVVVFRDTASTFQAGLVPATPANKTAAQQFLTGLQSRGETNVYDAIRSILNVAPREGMPGIIIVMTDGRPTAGVRDARTIINRLTAENVQGNTIFAYGAGNTVNSYLLDLLSYRNKGMARVVPSIDNISKDLPEFFKQLNDPILARLRADYGGIDGKNVFPKDVPDFFKGRAVTVYGRFTAAKDKEFFMRLAGAAESNKKEVIFKSDLRKAANGNEQIARDWAFQKIYWLIGEMCRVGEKPELLNELRQLSKKYSIRTSYNE